MCAFLVGKFTMYTAHSCRYKVYVYLSMCVCVDSLKRQQPCFGFIFWFSSLLSGLLPEGFSKGLPACFDSYSDLILSYTAWSSCVFKYTITSQHTLDKISEQSSIYRIWMANEGTRNQWCKANHRCTWFKMPISLVWGNNSISSKSGTCWHKVWQCKENIQCILQIKLFEIAF